LLSEDAIDYIFECDSGYLIEGVYLPRSRRDFRSRLQRGVLFTAAAVGLLPLFVRPPCFDSAQQPWRKKARLQRASAVSAIPSLTDIARRPYKERFARDLSVFAVMSLSLAAGARPVRPRAVTFGVVPKVLLRY
jgi:hypothetical protein